MNEQETKYRRSAQLGLLTGSLLTGLGTYLLIKKPEGSKALPVFMVVYGLVRLGVSAWQIYSRKKNAETSSEA
jgi:hypothetical protein